MRWVIPLWYLGAGVLRQRLQWKARILCFDRSGLGTKSVCAAQNDLFDF